MIRIHPTAEIDKSARIGDGTKVWHQVHVRERAIVGKNCVIGKNVYIDHDVVVGDNCRIQNNASLYFGATLEEGVFIGPYVCLANDKIPRAILPDGKAKQIHDWKPGKIQVKYGASIGASSVILPGVTIGKWAMVGAGSVVMKDIADHQLVLGCPAKPYGYVCSCGHKMEKSGNTYVCPICRLKIKP